MRAFAEKKGFSPKDQTRLMQDKERGIPLIYHRTTAFPIYFQLLQPNTLKMLKR